MRQGSKLLSMAFLAVLVVVNLVLFFLLLRPDRALTAEPAGQGSGLESWPTATTSATTIRSPSESGEQATSPSPTSNEPRPSSRPIAPAPAERLLFAVSSKTAWRATVGDCDTPGKIERSTNGGASWKLIVRAGLAPIVRLGAETNGNLFTIGGTRPGCSARYVAYSDDGTVTTSTTTTPIDVWFSTPNDRDEINGPGDTKATPCEGHVVGLAPLDSSRALVVCDNGAAKSSRDSGKTWRQVARIPTPLTVTVGNGRYWVASAADDCDGITVRALTVKGVRSSLGDRQCAPVGEVGAGQVVLDVSGKIRWVWAGSRVAVSTDAGRTWE
jgi:hypothetical protein